LKERQPRKQLPYPAVSIYILRLRFFSFTAPFLHFPIRPNVQKANEMSSHTNQAMTSHVYISIRNIFENHNNKNRINTYLIYSSLPPTNPARKRKYKSCRTAVTAAATYVIAAALRTFLAPGTSCSESIPAAGNA
jgi:hypothetical protein